LIGELSYAYELPRSGGLPPESLQRCDQFFEQLQTGLPDWVELGLTKNAVVYGSGGKNLPTED